MKGNYRNVYFYILKVFFKKHLNFYLFLNFKLIFFLFLYHIILIY